MKVICILMTSFYLLACGHNRPHSEVETPIPEVRLVEDYRKYTSRGDPLFGYHLQWDAPLPDERIVLVEIEYNIGAPIGPYGRLLIKFDAGQFRSEMLTISMAWEPPLHWYTIKILEAKERDTLTQFPHEVWKSGAEYFTRDQSVILKEHPFKPYRVGTPSMLRFEKRD